jgi:hypothetical protein
LYRYSWEKHDDPHPQRCLRVLRRADFLRHRYGCRG